jgi:hypothetical protein
MDQEQKISVENNCLWKISGENSSFVQDDNYCPLILVRGYLRQLMVLKLYCM